MEFKREPKQAMLASLCFLERMASSLTRNTAALTFGKRLAEITILYRNFLKKWSGYMMLDHRQNLGSHLKSRYCDDIISDI